MKLIVEKSNELNLMSKVQFDKLRNEKFSFSTADRLPLALRELGYHAQFTAKIKVGHELFRASIFVMEKLDDCLYINSTTAKMLKIIE